MLSFNLLNNKIWIFGTGSGVKYGDNSKYLFEYVHKKKKENGIRPIWLTKNKDVYKILKQEQKEVYCFYSVRGIYYSLISGVNIFSVSWIDLPFTAFILKKKKIIQLWHGTPFRRVNFKTGTFKRRLLRSFFVRYLGREFDLIPVATSKVKRIHQLEEVSNIAKSKIIVTGQPRTDIFFDKKRHLDFVKKKKGGKVFLYLPTWRNYRYNLFSKRNCFNSNKINDFLKKNNFYLVIKVHAHEFKKYKDKLNFKNGNRIIVTFKEDVYPYLPKIDCFLLDYSSIYFDCLLLDKPIVFLPFDIDIYSKDNAGFYYDYDWVTAGPKVKNWNETLISMKEVFNGEDKYRKRREEMNKIFNRYDDGGSAKRVFKAIQKTL